MYRLAYTQLALQDLKTLDRPSAERILQKLSFFAQQDDLKPFSTALKGFVGRFRFRIGAYRVIFRVDSAGVLQVLMILRVKHRKDIYDF